jgi:hypothetical protein
MERDSDCGIVRVDQYLVSKKVMKPVPTLPKNS